jgi:hypothetical protein
VLAEWEQISGYDIVVCLDCGFAFADNVPSQQHTTTTTGGSESTCSPRGLPGGLKAIHRQLLDFPSQVVADDPLSGCLGRLEVLDGAAPPGTS